MSLILSGTNGVSDVDGSAATPAIRGTDTNTGIFFPAADTIAFSEGGAEVARFDSAGNLGIGTSSPDQKLVVQGSNVSLKIADGTYSSFVATISSANAYGNGSTVGQLYLRGQSGIGFTGNNGGATQMVLDSSGNLLVGTTSTGGVVGTFICPGTFGYTTGSGANVFVDSSGRIMRSTSSLKYKTDVQDSAHGLSDVMKLRSVTYRTNGESDGDLIFGGLIAEEVHAAGLTEFVQYADDGTPDAISYGSMVSLAFKAIQEQQAIITALTARVAALEGTQA